MPTFTLETLIYTLILTLALTLPFTWAHQGLHAAIGVHLVASVSSDQLHPCTGACHLTARGAAKRAVPLS